MKKFFQTVLCLSLFVFGSATATAKEAQNKESQEKVYTVQTNKFWDNWFLSFGLGGQIYFGDSDSEGGFGGRIAPALQVSAGKWFTPVLGLRGTLSGISAYGYSAEPNAFTSSKPNSDGIYDQDWNMLHIHADVLFNVSNLFWGYNEERLYSFIPYAGFGVATTLETDHHNVEYAGSLGIINRFRVSKAWDVNLELNGMIVKDRFDCETNGASADGMFTVMVGATYRFGKRDFVPTAAAAISNAEIARIQDQLREAQEKNQELQIQNDQLRAQNKELQDELSALQAAQAQCGNGAALTFAPRTVFFRINQSSLSNQEQETLSYAAEAIKNHPNQKFIIKGFADKGTGSAEYNQELSQKRAQAVYDMLVNDYGIDEECLQIKAEGGIDNLFANQRLNRAVTIQPM